MRTQAFHCTIRNRGMKVRATVVSLPSRDFIQIRPAWLVNATDKEKSIRVHSGMCWRSNQQMARDSKGATTHLLYDNLYDLLRAGHHIDARYGAHGKIAGEVREMREDLTTARHFVRCILQMHLYDNDPERLKALYRIQADLIKRYDAKRNEHKVAARDRFMRGVVLTDALGRRNPSAAAMVYGAGIKRFLRRMDDIRWISLSMERRTVHVFGAIDEIMGLYRELWEYLLPANPVRDRTLEEFRSAFARIKVRPFIGNARLTAMDLAIAAKMYRQGDESIVAHLEKIRRGIRWIFALHALQMEVIAPLAYLLASGVKHRADAPDRFASVEKTLKLFLKKLGKCSDAGLVTPVKEKVTTKALDALALMSEDKFPEAKQILLEAAEVL